MSPKLKTLHDVDFKGQRVLLRLDLNAPLKDGHVQDDTRLRAALPTLEHLMNQGAKVIILMHLGRPKGEFKAELRVDPIAKRLSELLGRDVPKLDECVSDAVREHVAQMQEGDVVLLENTRFYPGEKKNDPEFTAQLAALGEAFVSDAFGAIHRAHASTYGLAKKLPAYAGFLIEKEVMALSQVLEKPEHPVCLLVGGAKIDTKIGVLENFAQKADAFLIGGALANTFLLAQGKDVGSSLAQEDKVSVAQNFLRSVSAECVFIPKDVLAAEEVNAEAEAQHLSADGVAGDLKILDIGPQTVDSFIEQIKVAKTVIWNGPMGLYEFPAFAEGTRRIVEALASSDAQTYLGGGDSIDAIKAFGFREEQFTHISTGGGAMLEFLEGKSLPGLEVLQA